jgi:peptide deformylase
LADPGPIRALYRPRGTTHISVMAILKIARMGHPVLRRPAADVADPTAPEIRALIQDVMETMEDADGAGLAAPQVHVPLRVVIFHVPDERAEDEGDAAAVPLTVLINPVIEPLTEEKKLGWEGCLSVPGLIGAVPRFTRIRYSGLTPDGRRIERLAEDFHARVVQHECDHLDGILYPQRMTDLSLLMFREELVRHGAGRADEDEDADDGACSDADGDERVA